MPDAHARIMPDAGLKATTLRLRMLASILLMATAARALPPTNVPRAIRPITTDERNAIEEAVRAQVSDPTAVRLRLFPNIAADGDYCGLVDGKNVEGDYVGYMPFHVRLSHDPDKTITVSEIAIATNAELSAAIDTTCARLGLDVRSDWFGR